MSSGAPNLDAVVESVLSWLPCDLDQDEERVSIGLYRLLAEGRPVSEGSLGARVDVSESRVNEILDSWIGVFRDDRRRVIGYWGLALDEMDHRFEVGGQTLYTWCAWDSLFIPHILRQTAHVESRCPVTQTPIRLTVAPQGVQRVEPSSAVVSFLTPDAETDRDDVVTNLCHFIHFFPSREAGARWVTRHTGTFLLDIDEAFRLGRLKNEAQYHLEEYKTVS